MGDTRVGPYWVAMALLSVGCLIYYHLIGLIFPVDDAYIVTHNVQTLLHGGKDRNFMGSPFISGATSAVHFALIALLSMVLPTTLVAQYVVAWLALGLYLAGLIRLCQLYQVHWPDALGAVFLGLFIAEMPHQLLNGLETGLALALMIWLLVVIKERPGSHLLPVLCGIMPFIRPEFAAMSCLIVIWRLWTFIREGKDYKEAIVKGSAFLLLVFLGALPWMALYLYATGVPYPLTISAKKFFFAEDSQSLAIRFLIIIILTSKFFLKSGLLIFGMPLARNDVGVKLGAAFLLTFLAAYLQFPGALDHYEQRYLYVLIPVLLVALLGLLSAAGQRMRLFGRVLLMFGVVTALIMLPAGIRSHHGWLQFTSSELEGVSHWCNFNLPSGSKLLIHDAGYISYGTNFKMFDLVGLKTASSIPLHQSITWPSAGKRRGETIHRIVMLNKPEYLIVLNEWDEIFRITAALRSHGWCLESLRPAPKKDMKFYEVYKIHSLSGQQPFPYPQGPGGDPD